MLNSNNLLIRFSKIYVKQITNVIFSLPLFKIHIAISITLKVVSIIILCLMSLCFLNPPFKTYSFRTAVLVQFLDTEFICACCFLKSLNSGF